MGKLIIPFNHKKDVSVHVASVRLANTTKGYLAKVSAEEIKTRRVAAYLYLFKRHALNRRRRICLFLLKGIDVRLRRVGNYCYRGSCRQRLAAG